MYHHWNCAQEIFTRLVTIPCHWPTWDIALNSYCGIHTISTTQQFLTCEQL